MRLSRVIMSDSAGVSTVAALLSQGDLDVLQLDVETPPAADYSSHFFQALRSFHKFFFLEPELRLITNAGGNDVATCTEALGTYLNDHGDASMPITAIRGDNLLARLPELRSQGLEFKDEQTGEPLLELSETLLSAQVQMGGGALATALAEDSRMIVAGSYDPAAPFLAAGVALAGLAWTDYAPLARLAVAAELSAQDCFVTSLDAAGTVAVEPFPQRKSELPSQNVRWEAADYICADVNCDVSSLQLDAREDGSFCIAQVAGRPTSDNWRVRFTFLNDNAETTLRWSQIPRDAIPLSVDTRSAAEWI